MPKLTVAFSNAPPPNEPLMSDQPGSSSVPWLSPRSGVELTTQADAKTRQVALSGSGCSFLGFEFGPRPATSGGPPLVAGRGPNLKPGREHLEKVLIGQFLVSIRTYGFLTERRGFLGHVAHGSPPAARRRGIARVGVSCIELHGA